MNNCLTKKVSFATTMKVLAALMTMLTIVFAIIHHYVPMGAILSMAITFGTIGYHFVMRLVVGYIVDGRFHNRMDYTRKWFQEKPFEKHLYERIRVKKWKDKMPSFTPEAWTLQAHTWEEIAGAMCQAEVVHSIIVILSFLPLLASLRWGAFWVFFITSILAAGMDSLFVIIQRYNRPRVIRMMRL